MNEAEALLRDMFGFGTDSSASDVFNAATSQAGGSYDRHHPDVEFALFGPSGRKELLSGREAFLSFVEICSAALADRRDQILDITGFGEQCAFVRASAYRKSLATGAEINYEWAMLYRVEGGVITYGTDMLDNAAQQFWANVLG